MINILEAITVGVNSEYEYKQVCHTVVLNSVILLNASRLMSAFRV